MQLRSIMCDETNNIILHHERGRCIKLIDFAVVANDAKNIKRHYENEGRVN
jgi:hypothetical protein